MYSRCTYDNGVCKATEASCHQAREGNSNSDCWFWGLCHPVDGACRATSDADCQQSDFCAAGGRCQLDGGHCVATEATCAKLARCQAFPGCAFYAGICNTPKGPGEDCAFDCKYFGMCSVMPAGASNPQLFYCAPTSDADCQQSTGCASFGRCHLVAGDCQPLTDADCATSSGCEYDANCRLKNGRCVPGTNEDCAQSNWPCKQHGLCRFVDGACQK